MENQTLTAIEGISVGHAHNLDAPTGCTVILCPPDTVGGVDQRGGAPATRETDLLRPMHLVEHIHAIVLSGGSAYGLDAASGVMQYLEAHEIGFPVGVGVVPIVAAASIFDLDLGDPKIRPDAEMGYLACENASNDPVDEGCIGGGAGARVGMLVGTDMACKSGVGTAAIELDSGLKVAALIVVNAGGDIYDENGNIIAGTREAPDGKKFINGLNLLQGTASPVFPATPSSNTVVGVVATNAKLNKEQTNKIAQMAQDGLAQAIRPAHTMFDGDTIFALSTGSTGIEANVNAIGAFAAEMTAKAIRRAVQKATPMFGLPTGQMILEGKI